MHIVITGANRGIGKALATQYRALRHQVTGTARAAEGCVPLDVTKPDSFKTLSDALGDTPVDLLICNAGVYLDRSEPLHSGYEAQMWVDTFAANVTGVFQTVQTTLPNLTRAPQAKVAIISSQMGSSTLAKGTSLIYRASKAAALNLGLNLSAALAPQGIALGIYHPGWVRTDMGGTAADLSVQDSATGLIARFNELTLTTSGCFRTWDGRDHPI